MIRLTVTIALIVLLAVFFAARDAPPPESVKPVGSPQPSAPVLLHGSTQSEVRDPPIEPAASVTIEVVDEFNSPRSGVYVAIEPVSQWRAQRRRKRDWSDRVARTDASGHAVIVRPEGDHVVGVFDPSDGAGAFQLCMSERCRFMLPRRQLLRVRVASQDRPVPMASVRLFGVTVYGTIYESIRKTDERGVATFSLSAPITNVLIASARHEDHGMASRSIAPSEALATIELRGSRRAGFVVVEDSPGDVRELAVFLVVRRRRVILWKSEHSIRAGEPVDIGLIASDARVTLMAFDGQGRVGYGDWSPTSDDVFEVPLRRGRSIALRAAAPPSLLLGTEVRITPPDPYLRVVGTFVGARDHFARTLGPDGRATFQGVPDLDDGQPWKIRASRDGGRLSVAPAHHRIGSAELGEIDIRLEARRTIRIKGAVTDTETSAPVPTVQIGLRGPGVAFMAALSDDHGRFELTTTREPPLDLYVEHPLYLPAKLHVSAYPRDGDTATLDASLVRADGPGSHSVSVRVKSADGAPIEGAIYSWRSATGLPLGGSLSSSMDPVPVVKIPTGEAILSIRPPAGSGFGDFRGRFKIQGDREVEVNLERTAELSTVALRFEGLDEAEPASVTLEGRDTYAATVRGGVASVSRVRPGRYDLSLLRNGVVWKMGSIDVFAPETSITRTIESASEVAVTVDAPPGGTYMIQAVHAQTHEVLIGARVRPGQRVVWSLPPGTYYVEAFDDRRYGRAPAVVPGDGEVRVSATREAGSCVIPLRGSGRGIVRLGVTIDGPVTRTWDSAVLVDAHGNTKFVVKGLPVGEYEIRVRARDGSVRIRSVDVVAGQSATVEAVGY